jgi:hypothetical protein
MKQSIRILAAVLAVASMLISACGAVNAPSNPAAAKVHAAEIAFSGMIESINGNQWTIDGQTVSVDPSVVREGPFTVGDIVKVEGVVAKDCSVSVTSIETPSSDDLEEDTDDVETAEASETPEPAEMEEADETPVPADLEGIVFDDEGEEAFGTVEAISEDSITIGEQTFSIANGAEFKDEILAGSFVKVHFMVNADGSLSITEIELADPSDVADDDMQDEDEDEDEAEDEGEDEDENEDEDEDEDEVEDVDENEDEDQDDDEDDDEDDNTDSDNDSDDDDSDDD